MAIEAEFLVHRRQTPGLSLAEQARAIAAACRAMAERFEHDGRLLAFGNGLAATDAHHVAVEFAHPVIVGKRALPALALTNDVATLTALTDAHGWADALARQLRCVARPADIALALSPTGACVNVLHGLKAAKALGLLTVALTGGGDRTPIARSGAVDHAVIVASADPLVVKEVHVTAYHLLWELVHVFLERRTGVAA